MKFLVLKNDCIIVFVMWFDFIFEIEENGDEGGFDFICWILGGELIGEGGDNEVGLSFFFWLLIFFDVCFLGGFKYLWLYFIFIFVFIVLYFCFFDVVIVKVIL